MPCTCTCITYSVFYYCSCAVVCCLRPVIATLCSLIEQCLDKIAELKQEIGEKQGTCTCTCIIMLQVNFALHIQHVDTLYM